MQDRRMEKVMFGFDFGIKKAVIFAGGVLFGTAGMKILGSKDAKKVYTETAAACLRAKDCVMETVTTIRENCDDILADAQEINEKRAAEEAAAEIEDASAAEAEAGSTAEDAQ